MITVKGLNKSFKVAERTGGLKQAAKSLFKRDYKNVQALQDISFSIAPGEIVGYIGPNGAGKSTTIKVMSGILVPDSGMCEILGYTPWKERTRYVRHIGVVFGQRSQLWWDVPVMDSFELLRDIYKVPMEAFKETLNLLIETLNLQDFIHTPVRQLSLGQRMRCEIAASLLHNPEILFLDEPTIGLDAVSKLAVRQFIKTYNQERKLTVILTTHDMSDIEALADRILLIGKGHLLYDGTLSDLREQFGATKLITVDYQDERPTIQIDGATLVSQDIQRAVLSVDTRELKVADVISQLSQQVALTDVTVDAQSIEEIVVQLYEAYGV
ncbi:ATP-binding cassette domain-containing protein [Pullulanibacillus sp. KACC 23026]|uniref:ABC transporter ATP-binding protein n=1 Tax=Pullulanibacillus sp. KACC 23026 TaxID=3028315 RepID=UPI0023AFF532|nr:ATP-binding cassette domain-containing protein [Pullulanibacillus sp. KACC 23026]WEG12186.1 ATP-binding cassette domain-containing protein [Pullulanibacillus sp. KACC 23026]